MGIRIGKIWISFLLIATMAALPFLHCGEEDTTDTGNADEDQSSESPNQGDRDVTDRIQNDFDVPDIVEEQPVSSDPVALWTFDESTGEFANSGTCDAPGTAVGNARMGEDGKVAYAVELEGVEQYITMSDEDCLKVEDGDFSYALWFKPIENQDFHGIYTNSQSLQTEDAVVGFIVINGVVNFSVKEAGSSAEMHVCTGQNSLAENQWNHLAVTRKNGNLTIYIDGSPEEPSEVPTDGDEDDEETTNQRRDEDVFDGPTCTDFAGDFTNDSNDYQIGNFSIGTDQVGFEGMIDDFHVFDYALTSDQILEVMARSNL